MNYTQKPYLTWKAAKGECDKIGKRLCTAKEICGSTKDQIVYGKIAGGDAWLATNESENDWIQIGDTPHPTCKRHIDLGSKPQWGLDGGLYNTYYKCCPVDEVTKDTKDTKDIEKIKEEIKEKNKPNIVNRYHILDKKYKKHIDNISIYKEYMSKPYTCTDCYRVRYDTAKEQVDDKMKHSVNCLKSKEPINSFILKYERK